MNMVAGRDVGRPTQAPSFPRKRESIQLCHRTGPAAALAVKPAFAAPSPGPVRFKRRTAFKICDAERHSELLAMIEGKRLTYRRLDEARIA